MTPKEKADQLLTRYINQWFAFGDYLSIDKAKQCALIAVDELIADEHLEAGDSPYWIEVKKEIEKL